MKKEYLYIGSDEPNKKELEEIKSYFNQGLLKIRFNPKQYTDISSEIQSLKSLVINSQNINYITFEEKRHGGMPKGCLLKINNYTYRVYTYQGDHTANTYIVDTREWFHEYIVERTYLRKCKLEGVL